MYTNTKQKIYDFIKQNPETSAKAIIEHTRLNAAGIFRHLKKLQKENLLYKVGTPPRVRYFAQQDTKKPASTLFHRATNWAISGDTQWILEQQYCQTRDVFHARAEHMLRDFKKSILSENQAYLLTGVVEEIGNNCFDHNLGRWRDVPGVYFGLDLKTRAIVIADRGIGVFATLKRVRPQIADDAEALRVAFTERVSGREPEQRGNGLKFVKKVVDENNFHLTFYTGDAVANLGKNIFDTESSQFHIPGTLAYILY